MRASIGKIECHSVPDAKNIEYTVADGNNKVLPNLKDNFPMLFDLKEDELVAAATALHQWSEKVQDTSVNQWFVSLLASSFMFSC